MKPGSKYYPLFIHLQACYPHAIELTFAELEALLNTDLPTSARTRKNWWSNRDSPRALQAGAWIGAGYHVASVDLQQQVVTFQRFQAKYTIQRQEGNIVWHQDAIKALRKHLHFTQAQFAQELGVRRQTVSEWENGVYDPDRSTAKFLDLIAKQSKFPESLDATDQPNP